MSIKGKGFTFLELTIALAVIAVSSTFVTSVLLRGVPVSAGDSMPVSGDVRINPEDAALLSAWMASKGYAEESPSGTAVSRKTRNFYIDESGVTRGYAIFSDDFEHENTAWVKYDADNDNQFWHRHSTHAHFGRDKMGSESYSDVYGPLTPDNWLVSPEIDLTAEYAADLIWFIGAESQEQPDEYYDVRVSTTGIGMPAFTDVVYSETVEAYGPDGSNYWRRCVDLAPYIGQSIHIAFRHWNCSGNSQLLLDDVYVIGYECIHNGDVDGNGYVTVGDAQMAFAIAFGMMEPTFSEECAADCNGDGWVTMGDGQTIYQVSLGMTECSDPLPDPPPVYEPIDIEEVYIAPGTFICGSPVTEPCREDETEHAVTLSHGFTMMTTEISRGLWAALKTVQPGLPDDPSRTEYSPTQYHPCQNMTWYEAVLFANLLSIQNGFTPCYYTNAACLTAIDATNYNYAIVYCDFTADGYRLPTEAEWEYAARAGSSGPFCCDEPDYTISTCGEASCTPGVLAALEQYAVFCANSGETASVTGSRLPNSWGLYDMHGNIFETCWDYYSAYTAGASTDPSGPTYGQFRMFRGSCWMDYAGGCRVARRMDDLPVHHHGGLGFRLVRTTP